MSKPTVYKGELIPHVSTIGPGGTMSIEGASIHGKFIKYEDHIAALKAIQLTAEDQAAMTSAIPNLADPWLVVDWVNRRLKEKMG